MGKKLYVGNLPFTVTDETLFQVFSECGEVASAKVITDRETQRSKGFGFVEMVNDDQANAAIERFNGAELSGRPLTVNEARPMVPRESRDFGGGRGRGSRY